jgi:hypothetical protein
VNSFALCHLSHTAFVFGTHLSSIAGNVEVVVEVGVWRLLKILL